jgi:hypothetical protein
LVDEIHGSGEQHSVPLLAGAIAEGECQVAFSDPAGAEEDGIGLPVVNDDYNSPVTTIRLPHFPVSAEILYVATGGSHVDAGPESEEAHGRVPENRQSK